MKVLHIRGTARRLHLGLLAGSALVLFRPVFAQVPPTDLPSGKSDTPQEQNPTDLPDLPSGQSFRPKDRTFTPETEKPAEATAQPPQPVVPRFEFKQITADGLSHTPCWVAGDRILFIRSEADYDPGGTDASFWKKFETGDQRPDAAAVHPVSYARGQLVLRQPSGLDGGTEQTVTHFEGKHLRGLQCPPAGDLVAVLVGEPGDKPSELALVRWNVSPNPPPVQLPAVPEPLTKLPPEPASQPLLISATDIDDYAWAETGERLYLLKDGAPWYIDPASGEVTKVKLPPFIRKLEFMAIWGGPRTSDLVLAGLDRDRKGKPFGNSLYVVNVKAATAVKLPPPRKGLGTRFEQWSAATGTVLYSSTDFTRFRLFRKDLKTGAQTELRPLPGDGDGLWRWHDDKTGPRHGIWARWNGAAYDQISLLGDSPDPLALIREGNFRSVLLSPSGTLAVTDMGTGGSAINGLQIRRDLGLIELNSPRP